MRDKEILGLYEAYMEVVENQQLDEEKKKYPYAKVANQKRRLERTDFKKGDYSLERSTKLHGRHERLRGLPYHKLGNPEHRLQDSEKTKKQKKPNQFGNRLMRSDGQGIRDSYDYYDIILSHLLDEGYAETLEVAEAIMVNMSEDWREEIMEGLKSIDTPEKAQGYAIRALGSATKAAFTGDKKTYEKRKKGLKMGQRKAERKAVEEQREQVDLFDYILEHLVAEGYADTNESALAIMANMSEEWRESIVEGKKEFPHKKVDRQVYDAMDSGETAGDSGDSAKEKRDYGRADRMRSVAAKHGGKSRVREEVDLFDTILEYLVSEGYADTNESALAIMANMSEEWRQEILESLDPDSPGNTHSLGDLYKAQKKWIKDNPHLDPKTGKPRKGGSGASSQAKDA